MKEQQQQSCPVAIIEEPLCTMNLFPVQWNAFKKSQQWDFQNQTCLISLVLVEEVLLLPVCSSEIMYTLYVDMEIVTRACRFLKDW